MKGKLLFLVLVIITIVAVYVYLRPVKPLLSIDRVYDAREPGSTVLVNVTISNVPSLFTWGLNLTWDPYYVQLTQGTPPFPGGPPYEIREGEFFNSSTSNSFMYFAEFDPAAGDMVIIDNFVTPGTYVAGSGVILTLNFTIVRVGTSAIEFNPPTPTLSQSAIGDKDNLDVDHDEMNGLVTNEGPPPVWASTNFQTMLIYGELGALGLASLIVYVYVNPRQPKSARKRADFQPTVDPQDQE